MPTYSKIHWLDPEGSLDGDMPVRKIGPSPVKNTGRVSTCKAERAQSFESLLERDFLILLETDKRVSRFRSQPIKLRWKDANGKPREYTPDVVVHYNEQSMAAEPRLRTTLFEVKPRAVIKEDWQEWQRKFRIAIAWSRENECRFKIMTEVEIQTPYLENIRILRRYRSEEMGGDISVDNETRAVLIERLTRLGQTTPKALLDSITASWEEQAQLIPHLWALVNSQHVGADLSMRLTMTSPIWLTAIRWSPAEIP